MRCKTDVVGGLDKTPNYVFSAHLYTGDLPPPETSLQIRRCSHSVTPASFDAEAIAVGVTDAVIVARSYHPCLTACPLSADRPLLLVPRSSSRLSDHAKCERVTVMAAADTLMRASFSKLTCLVARPVVPIPKGSVVQRSQSSVGIYFWPALLVQFNST